MLTPCFCLAASVGKGAGDERNNEAEVVSPLLICDDVLSIADPRTIQVARTIQERHLA